MVIGEIARAWVRLMCVRGRKCGGECVMHASSGVALAGVTPSPMVDVEADMHVWGAWKQPLPALSKLGNVCRGITKRLYRMSTRTLRNRVCPLPSRSPCNPLLCYFPSSHVWVKLVHAVQHHHRLLPHQLPVVLQQPDNVRQHRGDHVHRR